jgi:hypothetical protein
MRACQQKKRACDPARRFFSRNSIRFALGCCSGAVKPSTPMRKAFAGVAVFPDAPPADHPLVDVLFSVTQLPADEPS